MRKRYLLLLIIICIIIFSGGCKKSKKNPNEVLNYLKDLDTYSCTVDMQVINDKQTVNYSFMQLYSRDNGYRLELDGNRVFIYKDNKIFVDDKENNKKYEQEESFDEVYKLSFLGKYIGLLYTNEEIDNSFKNKGDIEYQLIRLFIPGNNRNINEAVLYVNKKTLHPEHLYIYDIKGNIKIKAAYKNFQGNLDVDENLFDVKEHK